MKPLLLILALSLSATLYAQTEKGTLLPGGTISFQSSDGSKQFTISPSFGVFVANNFAAGSYLFLAFNDNATIYGAGPYVRKYFGKSSFGKPFLHANGFYLHNTDDVDAMFGYGGAGGYAFFLNSSIALEFSIDFQHIVDASDILTIGTGFRMHLGRKKTTSK